MRFSEGRLADEKLTLRTNSPTAECIGDLSLVSFLRTALARRGNLSVYDLAVLARTAVPVPNQCPRRSKSEQLKTHFIPVRNQ